MIVEVCANSLQSALNAEKAGADRIELCSELAVGGITPSFGLLKAVKEQISIPVRVLIRPRSGDFTYTDGEFEIMKKNIKLCAEMGFDGVVSGVLRADFSLDESRCAQLVETTKKMKFTFHRAFDWVSNPYQALQSITALGVDTILSSGQHKKAIDGIGLLSELQKSASNITIMPGSGIHIENAHLFKKQGFKAIHLSAVQMLKKLEQQPSVGMYTANMLSDTSIPESNVALIQAVIKAVK